MTHPLLVWLDERLDERERVARAAEEKALSPWRNSNGLVKHSGPPESGHGRDDGLWDDEGTSGMKVDHQLCMLGEVAEHVALHDPAAVLALVEAHRALLELHAPHAPPYVDELNPDGRRVCGSCGVADGWHDVTWPCPTVRALASAYRHHPGWDEEWGPT